MRFKRKNGRHIFYFSTLFVIFIFILSACFRSSSDSLTDENTNLEVLNQPMPGEVAIIDNDIIVTSPLNNNDVIFSPLKVSGRTRVFALPILFRLKDSWGNIIAVASTTADQPQSGWGYYQTELEFEYPFSSAGLLEAYTENSEDETEQNLIRLPVIFETYKKPILKIYFSNIKKDPKLLNCDQVYPTQRAIEPTDELAYAALVELFKGPAEEEMKQGFITNLPEAGVQIQKLEFKDNTFYVDFNQAMQEGVAGSCRVQAIRAQIAETLKQFTEVEDVVISIDGETGDILQP